MNAFPLSQTRKEIMDGLRRVVAQIAESGISCTLWLDGSFLTEKIDPADVDLVALVPSHFYEGGTDEQRAVVDWLISPQNLPKKLHRCDTHAEPIYSEGSPFHYMVPDALEYWKLVYGRTVETGESKGIVLLHLEADTR